MALMIVGVTVAFYYVGKRFERGAAAPART